MTAETISQIFFTDYTFGAYNETLRADAIGPARWGPFGTVYQTIVSRDARNPHWRKLISQGECATTLFSCEEVSAEGSHTDIRVIHEKLDGTEKLRYYLFGQYLDEGKPPPGVPTLSTDVENLALSRFYSNLAGVESRFKGLVFTGELKESLSMIRHPARALRSAVSDFLSHAKKHGTKLPRRQRQSFIRKTWLEWAFGVKPLISDLDGAIQAFYASQAVHPIFEMVRGTAKAEEVTSRVPFLLSAIYNSKIQGLKIGTDIVAYKFYGTYKSQGSGIADYHKYGFSPWEFIPTIWELIPYSFLADYFTNIGQILESWSYRNLGPRFMSKTTVCERRKELSELFVVPAPNTEFGYKITTQGSPGSFRSRNRSIYREPNVGLPIPSLTLKVPGRWDQWVNMAALTSQLDSTRSALRR